MNGSLLSVPEKFYDHLVLSKLPDEEFVMHELIAELIGKYSIGVSDAWYVQRIRFLINKPGIINRD